MDFFGATVNAILAWNQIVLVLAGLFLLLIGGLCFAVFFCTRMQGTRVKGRVAAIRMTSGNTPLEAYKEEKILEEQQSETVLAQPDESFGEALKKSPGAGLLAILFVLMIVGVPLVFIGFGAYVGWNYLDLSSHGIHTQGKVVDNEYSSGAHGGRKCAA